MPLTSSVLVPGTRSDSAINRVAWVVFGALLTALGAQASVPWQPVPFTLQTLAVTLAGLAMGARLGAATQITYLGLGAIGLPVFANFSGGAIHLTGPTAGYLLSFPLAAALLGYAADRGWTEGWLGRAAALIVANLVILGIGTTWLAFYVPHGSAMELGFFPFLTGALVKSAVVWAVLPALRSRVAPDR